MRKQNILGFLSIASVFAVSAAFSAYAQSAVGCVSLSSDAAYGDTDAYQNGPILELQEYLSGAGYLAATPTGHFGPATLAAVEAFQTAKGVSATGYVGPLTRAALVGATCVSSNASNSTAPSSSSSAASSAVQTLPAPVATLPQASGPAVIAPAGGQTLNEGQTFNIQLSSIPYPHYDIVLISPTGAGAGFIASSLSGTTDYLWQVGTVFSSQTQSDETISPGSYQIRIQNSATGAGSSDPISSPFTISTANVSISSVMPTAAPANGTSAVVLYGSGFNASTVVNLSNQSAKGQILYVSPDGTVLVFSIPVAAAQGQEQVYVSNQSGQSSNQLSFTVEAP